MKKIAILGSTGSIGRQCLDVVDSQPGRFEVVALAAGSNVKLVAEQALRHKPTLVSVATEANAAELCARLKGARAKGSGKNDAKLPEIVFGAEGIERVATHPGCADGRLGSGRRGGIARDV